MRPPLHPQPARRWSRLCLRIRCSCPCRSAGTRLKSEERKERTAAEVPSDPPPPRVVRVAHESYRSALPSPVLFLPQAGVIRYSILLDRAAFVVLHPTRLLAPASPSYSSRFWPGPKASALGLHLAPHDCCLRCASPPHVGRRRHRSFPLCTPFRSLVSSASARCARRLLLK